MEASASSMYTSEMSSSSHASQAIPSHSNDCIEKTKKIAKVALILTAIAAGSALFTTMLGTGMLSMFVGVIVLTGGQQHLVTILKDAGDKLPTDWRVKALIIGSIALGCGIAMAPSGIALLSAGIATGSILTAYQGVSVIAFTIFMASTAKNLIFTPASFLKQKHLEIMTMANTVGNTSIAPQGLPQEQADQIQAIQAIASQAVAVQAQKCLQFSMALTIPHMSPAKLYQFLNEHYNTEAWSNAIKYAKPEQKTNVIVPFLKTILDQASEAATTADKKYQFDGKDLSFEQYIDGLKTAWSKTDSSTGKDGLAVEMQKTIWERKKDLYLAKDPTVLSVAELLNTLSAQDINFTLPSDTQSKTDELNKLAQECLAFCGQTNEEQFTTEAYVALGEIGFNVGSLQDISKAIGVTYGPALIGKLTSAELATKADLRFAGILSKPNSGENFSKAEIKQRLINYLLMKPKALEEPAQVQTIDRVVKTAKEYFFHAFQISNIAIPFIRSPVAATIGAVVGFGTASVVPPQVKDVINKALGSVIGPTMATIMRESSAVAYVANLCNSLVMTRILSSFSFLNFCVGAGAGAIGNLSISHYRQRLAPLANSVANAFAAVS